MLQLLTAALLLLQATIAGGGVIPHIHKSLINKVCFHFICVLATFLANDRCSHVRSCQCASMVLPCVVEQSLRVRTMCAGWQEGVSHSQQGMRVTG